jgi:hypothetical protein
MSLSVRREELFQCSGIRQGKRGENLLHSTLAKTRSVSIEFRKICLAKGEFSGMPLE